jgi:benzoyl-CoA reductase/2-hydroxyglutaryl-CoA dehydratase subunit BcrC/BadD/HgdB
MLKIGYFCTYTPVEIIRAAGYHPVRIKGSNEENGAGGESLLCSNICSYIKTLTDEKLAGNLDHLEGIVFTNSCDGMRRLYDAWVRIDKGRNSTISSIFQKIVTKHPYNILLMKFKHLKKEWRITLNSRYRMKILIEVSLCTTE